MDSTAHFLPGNSYLCAKRCADGSFLQFLELGQWKVRAKSGQDRANIGQGGMIVT